LVVDDDATASTLRSLRAHGRGDDKYDIARVGMNGRLDTLQAAVLLEKLAIFDDELDARRAAAGYYDDGLAGVITVPVTRPEATTTWAQYTVQAPARDHLAASLREQGIPTAVHDPRPLHLQAPYLSAPRAAPALPVAERLAQEVLSLPMHPYLDASTLDRVITAVREAVDSQS
jgi:dTDP-4-amino-4,6-dideoxygalactose transaminase